MCHDLLGIRHKQHNQEKDYGNNNGLSYRISRKIVMERLKEEKPA